MIIFVICFAGSPSSHGDYKGQVQLLRDDSPGLLISIKLYLTTLNIAKIFFPVVFNIDFQVEEFQEGMNYCGPCKEL